MQEAFNLALRPIAKEILSLVADGVISTDESGSIILANSAAEEIFGYNTDELLGQKIEVLMPQRHRIYHQEKLQEFGNSPSRSKRGMAPGRDVVGLKKLGEEFAIEASLTRHRLVDRTILTVVLRDIGERKKLDDERRLVTLEMSHRIKNVMMVVNSVVSLTARGTKTVESFENLLQERLRAMGRTVDMLLPRKWSGANLADIVETELAPFRSCVRENVLLSGPEVQVPASWAISLTLALHELATNAAKYGALSVPGGVVKVHWWTEEVTAGSVLRFQWAESGGPMVKPGARRGFGSDLILRALGPSNARFTYHKSGLEAHIKVPL